MNFMALFFCKGFQPQPDGLNALGLFGWGKALTKFNRQVPEVDNRISIVKML